MIGLLLATAGFAGARRSGSVAGGIWTGSVAAAISSVTMPGDAVLFHLWISDPWSLTWTILVAAGVVITIVFIGAAAARLGRNEITTA